ncbi:S9 family peptidase [Amycolatopsis jiangsuensis]|uniref:Dipeptidyl aminopeptidase/acylaminoacyl peptidase n=1 Tax=Amycolatopsis jiangsuensis TaxID=1181879 RepID=A0A840ILV5_9PSEU|nr:prolyl oligopeptidase family serine peptidase [Amycolatopsis jiangsuensis]MBB4683306.1 dipeptidyl aminopeptidase/acylaminoacyl peptidase [Amycolatopsis jiangsuensis]
MPELTAELITDGRVPQSPALSPDGGRVCYVLAPLSRSGPRLDTEVWLAGDAGPRRLTDGTATESRPRWSAEPDTLFFLSDRATRGVPQLQRASVSDGVVTTLTARPEGIVDYYPLADPHSVVLLSEHSPARDPIVAGEDEPHARLQLLDVRTGQITTPEVFEGRHVAEVRPRPGGGPLAVLTQASADQDYGPRTVHLHLFDPETGAVRDIGPLEAEAREPVWWRGRDGWHISYLALTPPLLHGGTAVFDLALRTGIRTNRTAGLPLCPTELRQTGGAPLVLLAEGLHTAVARVEPTRLATVAEHPGDLWDADTAGGNLAVVASTRYAPADVHIGPIGGRLRRVTDTRPEVGTLTWGKQEPLTYQAADGLVLGGLVVLPPGKTASGGPYPMITIGHGGPYGRYADSCQLSWFAWAQWLAAAGYAVFLPNPRGGQGRGHEFAARVAGRVGREEWADVLAGVDRLVADGIADPDRLGIAGWSHGGFLAAWAVGQTHRFRAAVVGAGITDWGMLAATGENGAFEAALGGSTGWSGAGPHPHDALSPISFADRIRTPVLLLHGAEDTNVPPGQAEYLHRALRHFGVPHEYVRYPREGHSIRERGHQLDVLHRTRAWFDRWLKSRGEAT